jgi:DNA-binding transcriptional LysR family regulator
MPRIDLNLLDILHTLVEEKSVSRAAVRLGVGQPAVSNALARLRHQVGDPLLVRSGNAMEPTARALELLTPVREALDAMTAAVEGAQRFDPTTYRGEFSIASVDYAAEVFAPAFAQRLRMWAPNATVRVARLNANAKDTMAGARSSHLVLSDASAPPGQLASVPFLSDDWHLIFRAGHPLEGTSPDTHALVAHPYVVSRIADDERRLATEELFAARGVRRRIAVTVPNSSYVATVIAATGHVALLCARLAERAAREYGVRSLPFPLPLPRLHVRLHWLRRHEASPLHRWLRERAIEMAAVL